MDAIKTIEVTALALRDAHQSLMATRMTTTEDVLPACADLDAAGLWSLERWGEATFDACIAFLNEEPWERLRRFKAAMPSTPLQMLRRGQNLLGYRHYGDDVVERAVDLCEMGCDSIGIEDMAALLKPQPAYELVREIKRACARTPASTATAIPPQVSRWRAS